MEHQLASEQQQRREAERRRATRTKRITLVSSIATLIVGSIFFYYISVHRLYPTEPEKNSAYPAVDAISCDLMEGVAFHIHAHLSIYINGEAVTVPQGIGIAPDGSCFYWLHTHTGDGVIHMEAPHRRSFTMGNFLNIWRKQFGQLGYPSQLNITEGWQVYVNGKPVRGDFHMILLQAHMLITLAYQSPDVKPDTIFSWNGL